MGHGVHSHSSYESRIKGTLVETAHPLFGDVDGRELGPETRGLQSSPVGWSTWQVCGYRPLEFKAANAILVINKWW